MLLLMLLNFKRYAHAAGPFNYSGRYWFQPGKHTPQRRARDPKKQHFSITELRISKARGPAHMHGVIRTSVSEALASCGGAGTSL